MVYVMIITYFGAKRENKIGEWVEKKQGEEYNLGNGRYEKSDR